MATPRAAGHAPPRSAPGALARAVGGAALLATLVTLVGLGAEPARAGVRTAVDVPSCPVADTADADGTWSVAWMTAPSDAEIVRPLTDTTVRQVIAPLGEGEVVRLRLQHRLGRSEITVSDVALGRQRDGAALVEGASCLLTFDGSDTVTIAPGASVVSDPVVFRVSQLEKIAVDFHVDGSIDQASRHLAAREIPFYSVPGRFSGDPSATPFQASTTELENNWSLLEGLDVLSDQQIGAVVAFGDSITDGSGAASATQNYCPCNDPPGTGEDVRYPDFLARRFAEAGIGLGVGNAGIGGNELLRDADLPQFGPAGLSRYPADVLAAPGVSHVVILIGINDLANDLALTPEELIAGYRTVIDDLHDHGLHVTLGTLTPALGTLVGENPLGVGFLHGTDEVDRKRMAVNEWIRAQDVADAVVDFDACVRDPQDPSRLRPAYDSGDHLHPNRAGYQAMADCFDLTVFSAGADAAPTASDPVPAEPTPGALPQTGGGLAVLACAALAAARLGGLGRRRTSAA